MTGVVVKICGVVDAEGAAAVAREGADWIGLNFWPQSKRAVDAPAARRIAAAVRDAAPGAELVGVFVNEEPEAVRAIARSVGLDRVQLHGDEPAERAREFGARGLFALRPRGAADLERARDLPEDAVIVVDAPTPAYGGTGALAEWPLARRLADGGRRVCLAGGLRPDNVAEAIAAARPFAVDVASGVESSPGIKDLALVRAFLREAKAARAGEPPRGAAEGQNTAENTTENTTASG